MAKRRKPNKKKKVLEFLRSAGNLDPSLGKDYLKSFTFEDYENLY